jgi:acyl carrier protein
MRELRPRIVAALAAALTIDPATLDDETRLNEDLGADSLAVFEALDALEDELGIPLPESTAFAAELRTVGDIVAAFASHAPNDE